MDDVSVWDLLIIGGGINGAGIARDAAGRGLAVLLAEQDDLAAATSSASSKLIHGGLRYLEHHEFRLVREALAERDVLLRNAPHIIWPLSFVLPHTAELRPAWLLRLGLLLYDTLGWRPGAPASRLPRSFGVSFAGSAWGRGLRADVARGFVYSDCWVDDARLVALNARDAADRGASIRTRTRVIGARREGAIWRARLAGADGSTRDVAARAIVNAAGPWAGGVLAQGLGVETATRLRLVKGSHIVVDRRWEGEHAFILQNDDRRIVFAIPYEGRFTLIGTTDVPYDGDPAGVAISDHEAAYLCRAASRWLDRPVAPGDVVRSYAGVRPLFDDGAASESEITRDYVLQLDGGASDAPALSVFGGKITTHRRLAQQALERLAPYFPGMKPGWTHAAPLPGGDIQDGDFERWLATETARRAWLPAGHLRGLARRHGTRIEAILGGATTSADLGPHFGAGLYAREIEHLRATEWAVTADDVLWRRTKLGLHLDAPRRDAVAAFLARA